MPITTITSQSPLRYPGGKSRAAHIIGNLLLLNGREVVSPFFGGGSVELYCAARGMRVYGYDSFTPLVEFWRGIQENPLAVGQEAENFYPLSQGRFYELQRRQAEFCCTFQRAAAFYALNRASFSGVTLSGGYSPKHPRFTRQGIEALKSFYNPNFTVQRLDFSLSVLMHPGTLFYCDPPYLTEQAIYGEKGNKHRGFDHEKLAMLLKSRNKWILSYNNSPKILQNYANYRILRPKWTYGMTQNKASNEVLILSDDIQLPYGWGRGVVEYCKVCGDVLFYEGVGRKSVFCSTKCRVKWHRLGTTANPFYHGSRVYWECQVCGKRLVSNKKYCSDKCRQKAYRLRRSKKTNQCLTLSF